MHKIPLTKLQCDIMSEFYRLSPTKAIYSKREYVAVWKQIKNGETVTELADIKKRCPAMANEIQRSYDNFANIQSAIFSECVYAQTLANIFRLSEFYIFEQNKDVLPMPIIELLNSYFLRPRYIYKNNSRILIQAGGYNGVDSALIEVVDNTIYSIEFKEKGAKSSEPDLPFYDEDGFLVIDEQFLSAYPQFSDMLYEQKGLNFFETAGHNTNNFSTQSILKAITNNYNTTKKYADVIVTADTDNFLVMLPVNQVAEFARLEGEIRPSGRNKYKVFTPNKLKEIIINKGGKIANDIVTISLSQCDIARQRGGISVSRYKISKLFFIRPADCNESGGNITFSLSKVWQLKPTITAKMFFMNLSYNKVKSYYKGDLK